MRNSAKTDMIYLDNSATTKQYDEVTECMLRYMKQDFGNPSALYQLGLDAEKAVALARKQVLQAAGFSGEAGISDGTWKVVFTSGGTEADNTAVFGAARLLRRYGKRIVTTSVEHPAVLECCKRLERDGYEVILLGVDRHCRLNPKELEDAINENTILVSMMQVNNEAGTVMPTEQVKEMMRRAGSPGLFHCDAVQSFGKMSLPHSADLISVSGHKIHGPKGSGALLMRTGKTSTGKNIDIPAYLSGGGQESGYRSGTENVPAIAGLGLASEISAGKRNQIGNLREFLRKGLLDQIPDIVINSPEEIGYNSGQCCPTLLNVSFLGTRGEVLLHTLEQDGIYVSTGSACSSNKKGRSHVLSAMGLTDREIEGTLRFSFGAMNTEQEVETVVEKTRLAVQRFRRLGTFR